MAWLKNDAPAQVKLLVRKNAPLLIKVKSKVIIQGLGELLSEPRCLYGLRFKLARLIMENTPRCIHWKNMLLDIAHMNLKKLPRVIHRIAGQHGRKNLSSNIAGLDANRAIREMEIDTARRRTLKIT